MSEKRRPNKNHPDFKEYQKKFFEIVERMKSEINGLETETKAFDGLDGPVAETRKKYHLEISQLQNEYSYLFEEVE